MKSCKNWSESSKQPPKNDNHRTTITRLIKDWMYISREIRGKGCEDLKNAIKIYKNLDKNVDLLYEVFIVKL